MPKTYYDSELTGAQIESALEAIHDVVTPSNNGKVLCIVNGAIAAKSASEWGHGAVLEPLSATANGDYTPPTGTDGFDSVHVAVPSATLTTKSITQNGTYNASSDNADGYSSVTVNVSGGGSAIVQPLSVTQNGTYTPPSGVDGYAPVTVNVQGGSEPVFPAGYTRVPYIESNGAQYIDTGISDTSGVHIEANACFLSTTGADSVLCGCFSRSGQLLRNNPILRYQSQNYYGLSAGAGSDGFQRYLIPITYGSMQDIIADTRNCACIITSAGCAGSNSSNFGTSRPTQTLFLFATNDNGNANYFAHGRIDMLKLYDHSLSLKRDYYSVRRDADGELGLWDIVSGAFFPNQGNGSFTTEV